MYFSSYKYLLLDLNILCFGVINKGELKATELSYGRADKIKTWVGNTLSVIACAFPAQKQILSFFIGHGHFTDEFWQLLKFLSPVKFYSQSVSTGNLEWTDKVVITE